VNCWARSHLRLLFQTLLQHGVRLTERGSAAGRIEKGGVAVTLWDGGPECFLLARTGLNLVPPLSISQMVHERCQNATSEQGLTDARHRPPRLKRSTLEGSNESEFGVIVSQK
jgi:hypothetical protein